MLFFAWFQTTFIFVYPFFVVVAKTHCISSSTTGNLRFVVHKGKQHKGTQTMYPVYTVILHDFEFYSILSRKIDLSCFVDKAKCEKG